MCLFSLYAPRLLWPGHRVHSSRNWEVWRPVVTFSLISQTGLLKEVFRSRPNGIKISQSQPGKLKMFPHCCSTKLITNQLLKHIQRWWSVLECMWTFQDKRLRCPWQLGYDPWKIPNLPNIPHIEYLTWPRCPNERCASSHLQSVGTNRCLLGQHRIKLS